MPPVTPQRPFSSFETLEDEVLFRPWPRLAPKAAESLPLKNYLTLGPGPHDVSDLLNEEGSEADRQGRFFEKMAAGNTAAIFTAPLSKDIVKVARNQSTESARLWHEYIIHTGVAETWEKIGRHMLEVKTPRLRHYITKSDEKWWSKNGRKFLPEVGSPFNHAPLQRTPSSIICAERIPTLTNSVCRALYRDLEYSRYEELPAVTSCLARIYLGQRRDERGKLFFTYPNIPLNLEDMERLGLERELFAKHIATALAMMHWAVGCDARGVEFVLARRQKRDTQHSELSCKDVGRQSSPISTWEEAGAAMSKPLANIWMLDFDQCMMFEDSEEGMDQLVEAFFQNDPYYPRPYSDVAQERDLWMIFKTEYLATSEHFERTRSRWPRKFIRKVEEEQLRLLENEAEGTDLTVQYEDDWPSEAEHELGDESEADYEPGEEYDEEFEQEQFEHDQFENEVSQSPRVDSLT